MKPRPAIVMAAVCNFLGLLVVSLFTSAVANTIFKMVDFGGDNQAALAALAADGGHHRLGRGRLVFRYTHVAESFAYRRLDGCGYSRGPAASTPSTGMSG